MFGNKYGLTLGRFIGWTTAILITCSLLYVGWHVRGYGPPSVVNPQHSSTAQIKVLCAHPVKLCRAWECPDSYHVYATVVQDTDGGEGIETFEIRDDFIDPNYRTADLFEELRQGQQTDRIFSVELRGKRDDDKSFRQIRSVSQEAD